MCETLVPSPSPSRVWEVPNGRSRGVVGRTTMSWHYLLHGTYNSREAGVCRLGLVSPVFAKRATPSQREER